MSAPTTPTKRVLTEEKYNAIHAPRLPYENALSDDLRARLQNVGSRVRRAVNEGYATQRSLPPTPYPSPAKPSQLSRTTESPIASPSKPIIFRSANDTLLDVFGSPRPSPERVSFASAVGSPGALGLHTPSPSPSPKKHRRVALEEALGGDSDSGSDSDAEGEGLVLVSPTKLRPGVLDGDGLAAVGNDMVIDGETAVAINVAGNPNPVPARPIRPLKKSAASRQAAN